MRCHKIAKGNFFSEFQQMVKRKTTQPNKNTLQALQPKIRQRYREYWENQSRPENTSPNQGVLSRTQIQVQSLESAYDPGALILRRWGAKLGNGKTQRCRYCQIETATTWDHFLPYSLFPDYVVYQPNLVRVCDVCNARKNANKVFPIREVIHPHFDPLDSVQFLHCELGWTPTVTANFSIQPDTTQNGFSPYLESVVKKHFDFFGLADVFMGEAAEAIGQLAFVLENRAEVDNLLPSPMFIENYSQKNIDAAVREEKNENCWEVAFWRATRSASQQLANFWTEKFNNEG